MRNMHSMDTTTLAATVLRAHVRVVCILRVLVAIVLLGVRWLVCILASLEQLLASTIPRTS